MPWQRLAPWFIVSCCYGLGSNYQESVFAVNSCWNYESVCCDCALIERWCEPWRSEYASWLYYWKKCPRLLEMIKPDEPYLLKIPAGYNQTPLLSARESGRFYSGAFWSLWWRLSKKCTASMEVIKGAMKRLKEYMEEHAELIETRNCITEFQRLTSWSTPNREAVRINMWKSRLNPAVTTLVLHKICCWKSILCWVILMIFIRCVCL